jgi:hypothetical protein
MLDFTLTASAVFPSHARNIELKFRRDVNKDRLSATLTFCHFQALPVEGKVTAIRRYDPLQLPAAPYIETIYQRGEVANYYL